MKTGLIVLIVVVLVVLMLAGLYNKLVGLRNRFKNAFAQIDVQLKRRYDLIPNLVETAQRYMQHERETLEAVIQARNQAVGGLKLAAADPANAAAMQQLGGMEGALSGALGNAPKRSECLDRLARAHLVTEKRVTRNREELATHELEAEEALDVVVLIPRVIEPVRALKAK